MLKGFELFHVLETLDAQEREATAALHQCQARPRRERLPQLQAAIDRHELELVKELNRVRRLKATTTVRHSVAVWSEGGSC
jgi:hypothetical protein